MIVKVDTTTICGTDLHILKGDVPAVTEGRILGHEAVGTVVETGAAVTVLEEGRPRARARDHVVRALRAVQGRDGRALRGGRRDRLDLRPPDRRRAGGVRARPLRRDLGPPRPRGRLATSRCSSSPTSSRRATRSASRTARVKPGDTIAVVGAGPVGLAAMMTAQIAGAGRIIAVDIAESRLKHARELRRDAHRARRRERRAEILEITGGAASTSRWRRSASRRRSTSARAIVRAGGTVANIGVHGAPTTLHLEELWIKNITITTGLVSGSTVPTLLKLARDGRIEAEKLGTHHFALGQMQRGLRRVRRGRRARRAEGRDPGLKGHPRTSDPPPRAEARRVPHVQDFS